jgi:hypothetical protein
MMGTEKGATMESTELDLRPEAEAGGLPAMVERASHALANAKSSAEVLEARDQAGTIYDLAKRAARLLKMRNAHDEILTATRRAQADALTIESRAKARLADEYDAAQERGEVAGRGRPKKIPEDDRELSKLTREETGLLEDQLTEARQIRDAEEGEPGFVQRVLDRALDEGHEPSRALVRDAIKQALSEPASTKPKSSKKNPHFAGKDPSFSAVAKIGACCCDISEVLHANSHDFLLKGFIVEGMRERHRAEVQAAMDDLKLYLEALDGTATGTAEKDNGSKRAGREKKLAVPRNGVAVRGSGRKKRASSR